MAGSPARHGLPPLRRSAHLPDDELADFIGAGSQRMFLRFCLRKLPSALVAIDGVTGDRRQADQIAVGIFTQIWETAPLWGGRTGEAQRQLAVLMAKAGMPSPSTSGELDAKRLAGLLRTLDQDIRHHPQRRPWLMRVLRLRPFRAEKSSSNTDGHG